MMPLIICLFNSYCMELNTDQPTALVKTNLENIQMIENDHISIGKTIISESRY